MKLHVHDPGHVALRRGVRAAIGVPITSAVALVLLPHSPAAVVAAFGSLCLLGLCDFGGTPRRRVMSLLGAGAAGAVLIAIGVLASTTTVSAVIVTLIVGFFLALIPVLRGSIGVAAASMTIMYVVAITAGIPAADVAKPVLAWLLAVAFAVPLTLWVLPRRGLAPVRDACGHAALAFADAVAARRRGEDVDADALAAVQESLRKSYLGNPFRAAGLNHRDRALIALAGHLEALLSTLIHGRAYPQAASRDAVTQELIDRTAACLRQAGTALLEPSIDVASGVSPSARAVVDTWTAQWATTLDALMADQDGDIHERVDEVARLFPDRAMAVAAVRSIALVREALGQPEEQFATGPHIPVIPAPDIPSGRQDLRTQLTLRSPWTRLALRTGIGLAIAVLVVALTGLAHGLWVVLGVTSVLRFDGLTTLRTAGWAVLGTFVGAAIGYVILNVEFTHEGWLWATLVLVTFLAVWVPGAVGFPYGQAAFSVFVIAAYSVMTWPPDLATATDRFEDVAVGAIVSVLVGLLLWPGGVLKGTVANVADAIRATMRLLTSSTSGLVLGGPADTKAVQDSVTSLHRAQEVVELMLTSPAPDVADRAYQWQALLNHLRNPSAVGRLLAAWDSNHGSIAAAVPAAQAPLMLELDAAVNEWERVAQQVDGASGSQSRPAAALPALPDMVDMVDAVSSADLSSTEQADRVMAAIWTQQWLQMTQQAGASCRVPSAV